MITRLPVVRPAQYLPSTGRSSGFAQTRDRAGLPAPAARPQAHARPFVSTPVPPAAGPTIVTPAAIVATGTRPRTDAAQGAARLVGVGPGRAADGPGTEPPKAVRKMQPHRREEAKIDLNRASAEELSSLRGVGRVTVQRIVAAREDEVFATVDALVERRVIGRSLLDRLRDQVSV